MNNSDEDLGIKCPGCGVNLTLINAGGYQCFCERCVEAMPLPPKTGKGYFISGKYPNFEWVEE